MSQQNKPQDKSWSKPVLSHLGKLADVAGRAGLAAQAGPNNRS